jgi:hypothetical protein
LALSAAERPSSQGHGRWSDIMPCKTRKEGLVSKKNDALIPVGSQVTFYKLRAVDRPILLVYLGAAGAENGWFFRVCQAQRVLACLLDYYFGTPSGTRRSWVGR